MFPQKNSSTSTEKCCENSNGISNPCNCCSEKDDVEKIEEQILEDFRNAMAQHAKDLQSLRDNHREKHKQYMITKEHLDKELCEKKDFLTSKVSQKVQPCDELSEAIEKMALEIDNCAGLKNEEYSTDKHHNSFLRNELSSSLSWTSCLLSWALVSR